MQTIADNTLTNKVEQALDTIRPFLREDGGDVSVVEITKDYVVKVQFLGACTACSMSNMTFKAGIKEAILKNVPEIKAVEAINLHL